MASSALVCTLILSQDQERDGKRLIQKFDLLAYGLILHHNRSLRAVVVCLGIALCEIIGTYFI